MLASTITTQKSLKMNQTIPMSGEGKTAPFDVPARILYENSSTVIERDEIERDS